MSSPTSSSSSSQSPSHSRSRSHRSSSRRTASQERQYTNSAGIVDPKCPLPYNQSEEAASDYMHYGLPETQKSKYKTFKLNCKAYVENGPVTWEKWTFGVRTECKGLGFSYDQIWRLATQLLPENLQSIIYKEVMRSDFVGLCYVSWKQLAGKAAVRMEPVALAIKEIQSMKFNANETVPEFIHRFRLVASRATAPSCGMAQSLRPSQVFTYLNGVFSQRNGHNPNWMIFPWSTRYYEVHNVTKQKCMALSVLGAPLTEREKDDIVDRSVDDMCDWAVTTATTREDTISELRALTATDVAVRANNETTRNNVAATARNGGVVAVNVSSGSARVGGRSSQRAGGSTLGAGRDNLVNAVVDTPPYAGNRPSAREAVRTNDAVRTNVSQPAYGSVRVELPPWNSAWNDIKACPEEAGLLTNQGQALAEFGFCTFEEANAAYKTKTCAACKRPYGQCRSIYECTAVPDSKRKVIHARSQYIIKERSNKKYDLDHPHE